MRQEIKSIGIDIGTSTTQLVFSRIVVENVAGSYNVPRVSIVEKEVIYRSKIYSPESPALSDQQLLCGADAAGVGRTGGTAYCLL